VLLLGTGTPVAKGAAVAPTIAFENPGAVVERAGAGTAGYGMAALGAGKANANLG